MADVTISNLSPLTVTSSLLLPVSNGSSTGRVSIANINSLAPVQSVAGKTGSVTLTNSDVGLGLVENKSSATIRGEITSSNVTTALGFTPYDSANPSGYITNTNASVARAWVVFRTNLDASGASNTNNTNRYLVASYNVGSVLRNAAGIYTVNFSPALATTNYTIQATAGYQTASLNTGGQGHFSIPVVGYSQSTTLCQVGTWDDSTNSFSSDYNTGNSIVNVAIYHL